MDIVNSIVKKIKESHTKMQLLILPFFSGFLLGFNAGRKTFSKMI